MEVSRWKILVEEQELAGSGGERAEVKRTVLGSISRNPWGVEESERKG